MLYFYFRFRFRPHHRTRHVTRHYIAKFCPYRIILSGDMMLYDFQDGGQCGAILLPLLDWMTSLFLESQCLSANQISYSYSSIHGWDITISVLEKTNICHIVILLPVSISTITVLVMSFCSSLPNFIKIGPPTTEKRRHIDFQDGGCWPCRDCFEIMADHTHSVFCGMHSVLKSLVPGLIFLEILWCTLWISAFWLGTAYSRPFSGSFGIVFSHMTSPIVHTPQGPSLDGNTSFEPFSVKIGATVRRVPGQDNKTDAKVLYFPYLGEAPTEPIWTENCMVGGLHDVITCANFHELRFYRGSNFRFSYWLFHRPYNSAVFALPFTSFLSNAMLSAEDEVCIALVILFTRMTFFAGYQHLKSDLGLLCREIGQYV